MLHELLRTVKTHLKVYRKKALDLNELHQPFPSKQEQVSIAKFLLSKFLSFNLWLSFKFKPKNYKSVKADKIKNLKLLIENKWWISAIILVKINFFLKHKTAEKHFSYTSSPFVVKQEATRWVANDMKFFCWPSQYVSVLAWSGHIAYGGRKGVTDPSLTPAIRNWILGCCSFSSGY